MKKRTMTDRIEAIAEAIWREDTQPEPHHTLAKADIDMIADYTALAQAAVEADPASFTDEDVERVAEAIRGALADTWTIARETTEAPTEAELDAAARAALSAYLEPTTKGDT